MNVDPVRVVICDNSAMDCELLGEGLRRAGFEVTGCAASLQGFMRHVGTRVVDVALIGVHLQDGPMSGFKALREARTNDANVRVVMLLHDREPEHVLASFRGGARGVFLRADSFNLLCKCIQMVHNGQVWASSAEIDLVLQALATAAPLRAVDARGVALLTKREEEVVQFVARGLTNREIALEMHLSEHTIKNYLFRIFDKLGVSSRVELALYCAYKGQLEASVA
jgi:DNA-binding NarL/FixJ family response regulator